MRKATFTLFALLVLLAGNTFAQDKKNAPEKKLISGNSFQVMFPQGSLGDEYDFGWGIYGNIDYNFSKHLAWRFDLGWNSLSGDEKIILDEDGNEQVVGGNMSVWEFTTGLKASISILYIEARGGYFTGINEWGVIPAAGLRLGKFDIQGNYKFLGDSNWYGARIAFYWGG